MKATTHISPAATDAAWLAVPLSTLIERLVEDHKRWRDQVLPAIGSLLSQRARREKLESLAALRHVFARISRDLVEHLQEEETVLFPAILEMERRAQKAQPRARQTFGSVRNPIFMIQREHEDDAELWDTLQHLALMDATVESASEAARTLYQELTLFADDVRQHTAVESQVLFPRAIQMEKALQPVAHA